MLHRVLQLHVPLGTASLGAVRNLLADQVVRAGIILEKEQAYTLRLASSELIDNAIKYSRIEHELHRAELLIEGDIDCARKRLRITITDPGLTVPKMLGCDDLGATGGRGLVVVAGYADDIGWGPRLDGEAQVGWSVWFELGVQELPPPSGEATADAEVQLEKPIPVLGPHTVATSAVTRRRLTTVGRSNRRTSNLRAA
ncbi:ATP-binding protein [Kitasatospora sp. NPDC004745]|uniref:ATP-binding protein n=1 Tax=Kitasatospora sp. NPDC004745 TaxID=3364019 RepID=UPI00367613E6